MFNFSLQSNVRQQTFDCGLQFQNTVLFLLLSPRHAKRKQGMAYISLGAFRNCPERPAEPEIPSGISVAGTVRLRTVPATLIHIPFNVAAVAAFYSPDGLPTGYFHS